MKILRKIYYYFNFKNRIFGVDDWFVLILLVLLMIRISFEEEVEGEELLMVFFFVRVWIGEDDGDKDVLFLIRKEDVRLEEEEDDDGSGRDVKRGILREGFGYVVEGIERGVKLRMVVMNGVSKCERERESIIIDGIRVISC